MPGANEIRSHIESVKQTRKITNAMYLISSTKMRRAKSDLNRTRPYFDALKMEIKRIFRTAGNVENRYFYPPGEEGPLEGTYACLIITADKGLAGAYNQNALREAMRLRKEHPDMDFYVVGEYGRRYCAQHDIPIQRSFLYTAQNPTMDRAREISSILMEGYETGEYREIYIVYTEMINSVGSQARSARLLPFRRSYFYTPAPGEKAVSVPFEFLPSIEEVLDSVMHSYVSGYIYSALVDSFCSEQQARMTAMDSANRNAQELLDGLSLEYNRVRQAAITQEITEISAGARAQRKKHRRDSE